MNERCWCGFGSCGRTKGRRLVDCVTAANNSQVESSQIETVDCLAKATTDTDAGLLLAPCWTTLACWLAGAGLLLLRLSLLPLSSSFFSGFLFHRRHQHRLSCAHATSNPVTNNNTHSYKE